MSRIGFWMSEKKMKKLQFHRCIELCRERGIELVEVKLDSSLESQGPFAAIVHKLSDMYADAQLGDETAIDVVKHFTEYFVAHPEVIVLDPLLNLTRMFNRDAQYEMVKEICSEKNMVSQHVITPPFAEFHDTDRSTQLDLLETAGITFPIICKPLVSDGPSRSHEMVLIFDEEYLADAPVPCVVQSLINHDAVLYKVFVMGDLNFVSERPSLKNFKKEKRESIFFHSGTISKPTSSSELTMKNETESTLHRPPSFDLLSSLGQQVRHKFGLDMLGVDVIVASDDGRLAIVDVNFFPGYADVPNFHERFCDFLQSAVAKSASSFGGVIEHTNSNAATLRGRTEDGGGC